MIEANPIQCGKDPFARLAKAWTLDGQSLLDHIASRLVRQNSSVPTAHCLSTDTEPDNTSDM